jgi:Signal transduction histidine kinase
LIDLIDTESVGEPADAITDNREEVAVTVSATEHEGTVTIRVADNGPGISDSRKQTVFGKGRQGLNSSGTGMGLHLVDRIVNKHGGEVWIEDNEPEGTVFSVELPTV